MSPPPRTIKIPDLSLVILVGASGSGKSTFARKHFKPTEVISSDFCRALVRDDETDQAGTRDAFEVLHFIARKRLEARRLTVVDATNVQEEARKPLVALARECDCLPVAIVLDVPERLCQDRNRSRADRSFGPHVVRQQSAQLRASLRRLEREGFRHVTVLDGAEAVDAAVVERVRLWNDRRDDVGPFDVIGDVHGCFEELVDLLTRLGYEIREEPGRFVLRHPEGRRAVFVGDLVDRGPDSPRVLRLVMGSVAAGSALAVPGNHDVRLVRKLRGREVRLSHGLAETIAQLDAEPETFRDEVAAFLDGLVSHYVLDGGKLVVAHAGLKERFQGRASGRVREFCLYGETSGETDEYGRPVRLDWAIDYRGEAMVVFGHTPVPEVAWVNKTVCVDTGCVFGGRLSALRYPEKEIVDVPARRAHYEPVAPPVASGVAAPSPAVSVRDAYDLLDLTDVAGKRIVETRLFGTVTIREENAAAALETMSRFAVDPRWIVYLPPTMSPVETAPEGDLLEHPREAFAYFRTQGVPRVVCQEKHMGSRAVVAVCRDADAARARFHSRDERTGVVTTRTGRAFFDDAATESAVLDRVRLALHASGFWETFATDWAVIDAELLPWSAKAEPLIREQYAAVGSAATAALELANESLRTAISRGVDAATVAADFGERLDMAKRYVAAYRRYCWRVSDPGALRLAPFHLLATEGRVHTDRDHRWHVATLASIAAASDGFLRPTATIEVDVEGEASVDAGVAFWREVTEARGGEGMVVKPLDWIVAGRGGKGGKSLVQPALKVRGPEYLRIIYGPEYTAPRHLERLRARAVGRKRSLALREFALGLEGLHRFVEREPLYRVHECVFGVLALESEPVDPRL